jgi:hypothetical protein
MNYMYLNGWSYKMKIRDTNTSGQDFTDLYERNQLSN